MEKYVPIMILGPLILILATYMIVEFCANVQAYLNGEIEMKKTLVMFGEYALVALVTVIIGLVFMVIYPMDVVVGVVKRGRRFFSDSGA